MKQEPMKLYEALRKVVEQFGEETLAQPRLKGFIQDFMPDDRQSIHMIQSAVTSQLGQQLLDLKSLDKSTRELRMASIRQAFQDRFFLREGIAEYIVDCFQYALGWKKEVPKDPSEEKKEQPGEKQQPKKTKPAKNGPQPSSPQTPKPQPSSPQTPPQPVRPPKPPRNMKKLLAIAAVLVGIAAFFLVGGWQWVAGIFAPGPQEMYVLSENTQLRAAASDTSAVLGEAAYGEKLLVMLPDTGRWGEVRQGDETKGYVLKSDLAVQKDMELLATMWGDEAAKTRITDLRHRRALIHFRREVCADTDYKLYAADNKGRNCQHEEIAGQEVFAFIADNKASGSRQAAVYSFDKEGRPLAEKPISEQPSEGQYVKNIVFQDGNYEVQFGGKKTNSIPSSLADTPTSPRNSKKGAKTEEETVPDVPQKGGSGFKLEVVDEIPGGNSGNDNRSGNNSNGTGFKLEAVDDIPN